MAVQDSNDGITNFIFTAIKSVIQSISTSNMATITAISEDKTLLNVTIDTTKEEIEDVSFVTIGGGGDYLQFPISVGDKCLVIFAKDSNEDWLGGEDDLTYASDFSINNGFALVGINNAVDALSIKDYTELKVSNKIKISNDSEEMVSLLSDAIQFLSDTNQILSVTTVTTSSGTYPLNQAPLFATLKTQIDALKVRFDTFKV